MKPVLSIAKVTKRRGDRAILNGVDLEVGKGELVALMGLSGGGKTTILRTVAALEPFDAGSVTVDGFALTPGPLPPESRLRPLRERVGLVFQDHGLFAHLRVLDNVTLAPRHVQRVAADAAEKDARELLAELGVGHRENAFPRELSGGEQQRVAIARALAMDPPLLLMDEPTASLDPARRNELGESLERLVKEGWTLLLTTHDDDFVRDFATRVVILAAGPVVEEGAPASVLENPRHEATRALLTERKRP